MLHEARHRGCRVGMLMASPEGCESYRRIDFRDYGGARRYAWEPDN
jgi:hypothetical protein